MATFTNTTKNIASLSNGAKSATSSFTNVPLTLYNQFLLLEDGFYMLLEDGNAIILEQSILSTPPVTNLAKS